MDRAIRTTAFGKTQPVDRAISAGTRNATEQGVACDLAGNEAGVELQHDFVPRDFRGVTPVMARPRRREGRRQGPSSRDICSLLTLRL